MRADKRPQPCDVTVYSDKGSLALRFPKRHNPLWEQLDGKPLNGKAKCLGIGKYGYKNNPEDWKRASQIAIALEADLDHPEWEKLFDPTLAKYGLGGGKYAKLADVLQLPGTVQAKPEITVGEMWEAYLEWKKPQLEETTYEFHYVSAFTNAIKGLVWDKTKREFISAKNSIWDKPLADNHCFVPLLQGSPRLISRVTAALSEAFLHLQSQGKTKITINPFIGAGTENKADKYKTTVTTEGVTKEWWEIDDIESNPEENDKRAFTREERDIIIKAFYESEKPATRLIGPLVEFLFLTGCRSGEAFALRWQDVFLGKHKNYIRFSKSYNGRLKNTQVTKTGEIRLFKIYPKLENLLLKIKPVDAKSTDLVFVNSAGTSYTSGLLYEKWVNSNTTKKGIKYDYPGVVTQLADTGVIGCCLSPYHTRHTFITLQAHAGTDLLLLATACGNSVEVIQRHYLGIDTEVEITDI
ncbi:tyrosine-type recombinase/integrase [Microcoleus sp. OTE_8_concoct_300]|uniref:tyrosine-type recombinase/integrase n=1 Tax=Microcoleus sp. OTE_8_concoct_300 TaxID=2964710 RepID=UPI00403F61A0